MRLDGYQSKHTFVSRGTFKNKIDILKYILYICKTQTWLN